MLLFNLFNLQTWARLSKTICLWVDQFVDFDYAYGAQLSVHRSNLADRFHRTISGRLGTFCVFRRRNGVSLATTVSVAVSFDFKEHRDVIWSGLWSRTHSLQSLPFGFSNTLWRMCECMFCLCGRSCKCSLNLDLWEELLVWGWRDKAQGKR